MKKRWIPIYLFIILLLVSCQNDKPKPETSHRFSFHLPQVVEAAEHKEVDPFFVKYQVKESNVFIECIAQQASFRDKEAKILVVIDGKKKMEVRKSAFIIKGLEPGKHHIELHLKIDKPSSTTLKEEFHVQIN